MTTEDQLVSLPIIGGLDEKSDSLLSSRPQAMTNCLYRKTGAVSKRYGYSSIGPYNLRSDGSTPGTCENLFVRSGELVRVGAGKLDSFALTNGISDWVAKDPVPEAIGSINDVAPSVGFSGFISDPSIAIASGYVLTAYVSSSSSSAYLICLDISSESTGARIGHTIVLSTSNSQLLNPRIAVFGTTAGIFWYDQAATSIKGYFYDLTTLGAILGGTVHTGIAGPNYDVSPIDATHWVFFAESSSLSGSVYFAIDTTYAIKWAGLLSGETSLTAVSVRSVASERIYIAYGRSSAPWLARIVTITPAGAPEYGPTTVQTNASGLVVNIGVERLEANRIVYAWTVSGDGVYWNEAITIGSIAKVNSIDNRARDTFMLARPLVRSKTQAYALVANVHGTHATPILIDLAAESYIASGASARVVGVVLPRQLQAIRTPGTGQTTWLVNSYPRLYGVSDFPSNSASGTFSAIVQVPQDTTPGNSTGMSRMVPVRWRFDSAWSRTAVEVGGALVIGGGVISAYDGVQAYEIGFLYEPDITRCAALSSSGAGSPGLVGNTSYSYVYCYAWTDALGNTHRGIPSAPITIALPNVSAYYNVSGSVPPIHLTNKFDSGQLGSTVFVEVYRTTSNSTAYHYVTSIVNSVNGAPISFTDTASDASIASNRTIYTSGNVLDHVIPAGCSLVTAFKGCLLAGGSDDDSMWISGEILPGEGPWFNDTLNLSPFEGGRITALAQIDDTPIVFKANGAWYLQGEPPSDTGDTNIGLPKRIQTEAGCSDPASVVVCSEGIGRMSANGIYLMNRSLQDQWIGRAVENSYRGSGFAGAAFLPSQGLIRWVQKGTGGFDALNYDYYHSAVYGTPVWSKDVLTEAQSGGYAQPVAATVWNGAFVWISSTGYLYQESTSQYYDSWAAGGSSALRPVYMSFATAFEKPATVSAFQRVKRVWMTGQKTSSHALTVTITTDQGSEARTWSTADVASLDKIPIERVEVHVKSQKCQWMQIEIDDAPDIFALGDGSSFVIRDITLKLGVKPGGPRLPSKNTK